MLVLQLPQNQVGGGDIGGSIGSIIAHFKYDARIEIKRRLSIDCGLIVNREVVQRFTDALIESIATIKKDKPGGVATLKKYLKLDDDAPERPP